MRVEGNRPGALARFVLAGALGALAAGCAHAPAGREGEVGPLKKELARQLMERGDWRGAFELLNALHRERPDDAEVLAMRGVVYRETGMRREAKAELTRSLALAPDLAYANGALGVLLDEEGDREGAAALHRRAVAKEPRNATYLNNAAFNDYLRGRTDEAISGWEEALRHDPTHARCRNNLGFALARKGDFERAREEFERAGPPAEARNNLGFAHELSGHLDRALEHYLAAAQMSPPAEKAKENLARLSSELGVAVPADAVARTPPPKEEQR